MPICRTPAHLRTGRPPAPLARRDTCLQCALCRHQTVPAGGPIHQPPFINGVARFETADSPLAVLHRLQGVEQALGRVRHEHWAARTIDLDLLLYDDLELQTPELTIPHPRFSFRRFAILPAAEIAPELIHPPTGWSIAQLAYHSQNSFPWIALAGGSADFRQKIAHQLVQKAPQPLRLVSPANPPTTTETGESFLSDSYFLAPTPVLAHTAGLQKPATPRLTLFFSPGAIPAAGPTPAIPFEIPITGPVLILDPTDVPSIQTELYAALTAMR